MGDTSEATLQPATADPEKLEETLLSLCHQLQSLKGYSSIEGNRLVEVRPDPCYAVEAHRQWVATVCHSLHA